MIKKIVVIVLITLFVMTSFAFLPCISATITVHKSNEIAALDKDVLDTTVGVTTSGPPWPPLMWTEDFTTFYILFVDPEGDDIWIFIDWGDGTHEEWIGPYKSGEIISISHNWFDEGTYQIKLKVRDFWDDESPEAVYSLTLYSDFKFFHPSSGYVGITYKFTIYLEDYGLYIFDWGDETYSGWVTGIAEKSWSSPGCYYIKWRAKDIHGYVTPWSDPVVITIATFDNQPPGAPDIDGPVRQRPGTYEYTFRAIDPDGDDVCYFIEWGDGTVQEWTDLYPSGEVVTVSHTFTKMGTYKIQAKARDVHGVEGPWSTMPVRIPRSRQTINMLFLRFLQNHPHMFLMLKQLLGMFG